VLTDAPGLRDFQLPYARAREEVRDWARGADVRRIELADVVAHAHPTILIGTSTQAGAFTESIVKDMAAHTERPIIMPLSNPTSKAEAVPADLIAWTDGRVLTATGSPFSPVAHGGRTYQIAQANNALVFPGIGLGVAVVKATRISDRMIAAASEAVARLSDTTTIGGALLPPMTDLRFVSAAVALAVANTAVEEGFARVELHDPIEQVQQAMWHPEYPRIVL
jgi:malate dehydrogenase (oxaloacetate-decarboxylating)